MEVTMLAKYTDIERAAERLRGILMGISIDNYIRSEEVKNLNEWLQFHPYLHDKMPFKDVVKCVKQAIADNYIDTQEREEILELCWMFDNESIIPQCATAAIRRLHGVLQGIALDNQIHENEVVGLKNWLEVHDHVKEYWPFCDLCHLVSEILDDGIIDQSEKEMLLDYCLNFSEILSENPIIHDSIYGKSYMSTYAPVLKPFAALCDRDANIIFDDRTFCFTGLARIGSRKDLHEIVSRRRGIPKNSVSLGLDYLVIGAQSSPCWAYSTYGRKIEKVLNNRENGSKTIILHEDDFIIKAEMIA